MKIKNIIGWAAVVITTAIASFWAFWGSIENFHEGWHNYSFWMNVALEGYLFQAHLLVDGR